MDCSFKRAHFVGSVNTTADIFSWLELEATEKIRLKIRGDKQTTFIEKTTYSSDVPDAERFFLTEAEKKTESEEQTFNGKNNPGKMQHSYHGHHTECVHGLLYRVHVQLLQKKCAVVLDCSVDITMPHGSSFACFSLQCLFE